MKIKSPYPKIHFEGIDQLGQVFHVFVIKQTYTWDEMGCLVLAQQQDDLHMQSIMVDDKDVMQGVLQEADICHYKPNCDVLVVGHAYAPENLVGKNSSFNASIKVYEPETIIHKPKESTKYQFAEEDFKGDLNRQSTTNIAGNVLLEKTLQILHPRKAVLTDSSVGDLHYTIEQQPLPKKVSLNPVNSFGGYAYIEENDKNKNLLANFSKNELLAESDNFRLNNHHEKLAYIEQEENNPYGTGYLTPNYCRHVKPKYIQLPNIHYENAVFDKVMVNKMVNKGLDETVCLELIAGFGVCPNSHLSRQQFIGELSDAYFNDKQTLPDGFDFRVYNCAYPDQQISYMHGDEVIELTNLCHSNTKASKRIKNGDTKLTLYLPKDMLYLEIVSERDDMPDTELPLKLDTLVIQPDDEKINLVWRAMLPKDYQPKEATLGTVTHQEQIEILQTYDTNETEG